jgi:hypothetical protein
MIRITTLFLLAVSFTVSAQDATDWLEANRVRCLINSTGGLFNDQDSWSPGFEVPAGEGVHTIYSGNLWVGGLDEQGALRLAAELYGADGTDWYPGPLTMDGTASTTAEVMDAYNRVWEANREGVNLHISYFNAAQNGTLEEEFPNGYNTPDWILEWPAHGDFTQGFSYYLAPFFDYNGDGVYTPLEGDYPLFCGDQCLYVIFNDKGGVHSESGGEPIGLEVHAMLYGFSDPSDAMLYNTVFLKYTMFNRGNLTLSNTYLGFWNDFDIGTATDDYIATDVLRSSVLAYNGDAFDEPSSMSLGYGSDLPAQALQVLAGPFADGDGMDNPLPDDVYSGETDSYGPYALGYGDGVPDNERLGLSTSRYYNNSVNPINGQPTIPVHFYYYLQGLNLDGGSTIPVYSYYGASDPLFITTDDPEQESWSEESSGNAPNDRRILGSSGPFTLSPGEEFDVDLAYVFARESDDPEEEVRATLDSRLVQSKLFYNEYLAECPENQISIGINETEVLNTDINLFPNPATDQLNVRMSVPRNQTDVVITDLTGKVVLATRLGFGYAHQIDVSQLPSGSYFVSLRNGINAQSHKLFIQR